MKQGESCLESYEKRQNGEQITKTVYIVSKKMKHSRIFKTINWIRNSLWEKMSEEKSRRENRERILRRSDFTRSKLERMLENLNLDFSSTASEEQFGEQEKPLCARLQKLSPPGIFSVINLSFSLLKEAFLRERLHILPSSH